ncbi:MAG: dethiobiotin synthase [Burkholderiales bacterium]|nr:dethiobiotin synthase [Ferrovum sp.]
MNLAWFVTGTDTGVGKTMAASALLHGLQRLGRPAIGMKPVASGCHEENGLWINEDVQRLVHHSSIPVLRGLSASVREAGAIPWQTVNPYAFEPAIAPHIAAARAGIEIRFEVIQACFSALRTRADVVIEGAGGFRVPLGPDGDTADLCQALAVPVILVVGMRLGCINHALLTVDSIRARNLVLAGWVANRIDPHMPVFESNLTLLKAQIPAPCLGIVPFQQPPRIGEVALAIEVLL